MCSKRTLTVIPNPIIENLTYAKYYAQIFIITRK